MRLSCWLAGGESHGFPPKRYSNHVRLSRWLASGCDLPCAASDLPVTACATHVRTWNVFVAARVNFCGGPSVTLICGDDLMENVTVRTVCKVCLLSLQGPVN